MPEKPAKRAAGRRAVEPALRANGLTKVYGSRAALREVSFEARRGELVAVIGPNGAGKTTLLSILAGIVRADQGEVEAPGGGVGWVPQQAALYRRLTVGENLRLFAHLEKVDDVEGSVERRCSPRPASATAATTRSPASPGGNQQRVNIAIGLLRRPAVLLLDEPSTGLDPRQRASGCGNSSRGSPAAAPR